MKKLIPSVAVRIDPTDVWQFLKKLAQSNKKVQSDFEQSLCQVSGFQNIALYATARYGIMELLKTLHSNNLDRNEVIIPSYTCPTVLFSVLNAGLIPVIADIDITTLNIDPENITKKIGTKTLALIAVHMYGNRAELSSIREQLKERRITLIEDYAQSFPEQSDYENEFKPDYAVISFGKGKYITTVQGGAILSDNSLIISHLKKSILTGKKLSIFKQLLMIFKALLFPLLIRPEVFWVLSSFVKNEINSSNHQKIPKNWEFSKIQTSMGYILIGKIYKLKNERVQNGTFFHKNLSSKPGLTLTQPNQHKYLRFCSLFEERSTADRVMKKLWNNGVMATKPRFDLSIYHNCVKNSDEIDFVNSRRAHECTVCLPTHGYVTEKDAERISRVIEEELCL